MYYRTVFCSSPLPFLHFPVNACVVDNEDSTSQGIDDVRKMPDHTPSSYSIRREDAILVLEWKGRERKEIHPLTTRYTGWFFFLLLQLSTSIRNRFHRRMTREPLLLVVHFHLLSPDDSPLNCLWVNTRDKTSLHSSSPAFYPDKTIVFSLVFM